VVRAQFRRWQREAFRKWDELGYDFLAEATPGAGKTRFALELANRVRARTRDIPLSFVCPTAHLRNQWQQAAHQVGIELSTDVVGPRLEWGYSGLALTYQQVLSDPERFRRAAGEGWVALDECHHAGEGRSWAEALMHAFGNAKHRLSLSGTAFRSDACRIPFDTYARLKRVAGRTVAQLDEPALVRHIKLVEAWLGRTEHAPA
jgi:superfamily II DNA or RNA helicase